jgi:Spy/CpxP family protein refolding chaperone
MNIKSFMIASVFVIAALFIFMDMPVYAQKDTDSYRLRQKWSDEEKQAKFDKMVEKLGLSDEQVTQLKVHKQARMESREKLYSELNKQKRALRDELEKPVSDNARIKQISASIKQIHFEMVDERIKSILEIKVILTPEQYSEFKANIYNHKERENMKRADSEEKPLAKRKPRRH